MRVNGLRERSRGKVFILVRAKLSMMGNGKMMLEVVMGYIIL